MNLEYVVAIDLDGVLANWQGRVEEILGGPIDYDKKGKVWAAIQHYNDTVQPFYETLDKMPDADILFNFVKSNFVDFQILSAGGFTPKNVSAQKHRWVAKHYGSDVVVNVVTKSPDKARYASPNAILIDDREKSIDPWVAAGGIGILHTNAEDSIRQLKEICGI